MALPFGVWDVSEAFNRAQDFEEEQEEQTLEEDQTEDDEFIVRFTPTIKQSLDSNDRNNSFLRISKLIITSDDVGAAFTDAYLLNQNCNQKIGLISGPFASSQRGNTVSQNHFWDKSCFLYTLSDKPDVIVCQMKQSLDEKFVFDWVDKVCPVELNPKCNQGDSESGNYTNGCNLNARILRDQGRNIPFASISLCFATCIIIPHCAFIYIAWQLHAHNHFCSISSMSECTPKQSKLKST